MLTKLHLSRTEHAAHTCACWSVGITTFLTWGILSTLGMGCSALYIGFFRVCHAHIQRKQARLEATGHRFNHVSQ